MKWEDLMDWGFVLFCLFSLMLFSYLAKSCEDKNYDSAENSIESDR